MPQIESLLSARLFLTPQIVGDKIYFLSNMSGRLSLYVMDAAGSVPEPLLPPQIALQNPHLIGGYVFHVFPKSGRILVMIDQDGDENYQPMTIPLGGGIPEPAFGNDLKDYRVHCVHVDGDANLAYFNAESRLEPMQVAYQGYLPNYELRALASSPWGAFVAGVNDDHSRAIILDGYTAGDSVMYEWTDLHEERRLLLGTPLEARTEGQEVPLTSFGASFFMPENHGLLFTSSLFSDTYGLTYLPLTGNPPMIDPELEPEPEPVPEPAEVAAEPLPVEVSGIVHSGAGELDSVAHLRDNRYLVGYNIDGCSWQYEGTFDADARRMNLDRVIVGAGPLANGVLESIRYDKAGDRYAISYSTATSPTQMYVIEGPDRQTVRQLTRESVLGIPRDHLAPGEDASFTSFDGTRVSARLYLPAPALRFDGPRPLVYYVHGGPQGQERPDFAWFSMPLIQFLTLNGFAVFVPNVRGSTGYGLRYMKQVDHDWGGKDRLDHVHAMQVLAGDRRIDTKRAAVMGRSYGGYMTLTLASRHPDLWRAAVDMFGPYDLIRFMEVIPETWKPYFKLVLGDPEQDRDFLVERSPRTYIDNIRCPMLVIQGMNDPRVKESESRAVVEGLRAQGKQVDYLVFENEGHDVLKFENRITCYNAITGFFKQHLG